MFSGTGEPAREIDRGEVKKNMTGKLCAVVRPLNEHRNGLRRLAMERF